MRATSGVNFCSPSAHLMNRFSCHRRIKDVFSLSELDKVFAQSCHRRRPQQRASNRGATSGSSCARRDAAGEHTSGLWRRLAGSQLLERLQSCSRNQQQHRGPTLRAPCGHCVVTAWSTWCPLRVQRWSAWMSHCRTPILVYLKKIE